ncbi:MAG: Calx-beta domain-containing protein [Cytophagales bacterium]|nr:Calx-beta domain-containing protein [Cytophagales bacterium]
MPNNFVKTMGATWLNLALATTSMSALGGPGGSYYRSRRGYTSQNQYLVETGLNPISSINFLDVPKTAAAVGGMDVEEELNFHFEKGQKIKELLIVDGAVQNKSVFLSQDRQGVDIIEIESGQSGIVQLLATLTKYRNLEAVHVISHATSGKLQLGNDIIDAKTFEENVSALVALNGAIKPGGDLLFYGCELAKGAEGQRFLEVVKGDYDFDIAASNDLTGNDADKANWDLEIQTGDIEATPLPESIALKDFTGTLQFTGTIDFSQVSVAGALNGAASTDAEFLGGASAPESNYTLVVDGTTASTYAYTLVGPMAARISSTTIVNSSTNETNIRLRFDDNAAFTATSLSIGNYSTTRTFTVKSSLGVIATSSVTQNYANTVPLSTNNSGITYLDIYVSDGMGGKSATYFVLTDLVISGGGDTTPPEVTSIVRQSPTDATTNATSATFRVTFDEDVSNVSTDGSDFTISGAGAGGTATITGASAVTGSTVFDVTVGSINTDGLLDLGFAGGQDIQDAATNAFALTINSEETYTIDQTGATTSVPDLATTSDSGSEDDTSGATSDNRTFDLTPTLEGTTEVGAVVAITSSAVGGLGNAIVDGSGNWTFTPSSDLPTGVHTFTAQATDAIGNTGAASGGLAVILDNTGPTVTLSSSSSPGPTNDNPIPVTITFSEEVERFKENEITVGNGTTGDFASGDSTTFTVNITPSMDGAITVDVGSVVTNNVAAAIATDLALNPNSAATQFTINYDGTAPTISSSTPTDNATGVAVADDITITFNENIQFGTGAFQLRQLSDNSPLFSIDATNPTGTTNVASISGATLTINPGTSLAAETGYYVFIVSGTPFLDLAGNPFNGLNNNSDLNFTTVDVTAPTITGVSLAADNGHIDVTFSEGVFNTNGGSGALETSDFSLSLTGGAATSPTVTTVTNNAGGALAGGETTIRVNFSVTGTPNGSETLEVDITDGTSIFDAAGNGAAANQTANNTATLNDQVAPSFVSTSDGDDATYRPGQTITFTADLGETGLTVTVDASVLDTNFGSALALADQADGTYTVTTGVVNSGTIQEGTAIAVTFTATDAAGNSQTDNSLTLRMDKTNPTPTISFPAGGATNSAPISYTVTFDEEINGTTFTSSDITLVGGTITTGPTSSDNITFTGTLTPTVTNDDISFKINSNRVSDLVGLNNFKDTTGIVYDIVVGTISSVSLDGSNGFIDVSFSENVYNTSGGSGAVATSDFNLSLTGGSATSPTVTTVTTTGGGALSGGENAIRVNFTVTGTPNGSETLEVDIADGTSIFDFAGNAFAANQTSNNTATLNDQTVPAISSVSLDGNNGFIDVTFSEGLFNTNGGSGAVESSDFALSITGGAATSPTVTTVTNNAGGALSGGETTIRVNFTVTGTPNGGETLEVDITDGTSIFDAAGNAAAANQTANNTASLNDQTAPEITSVSLDASNDFIDVTFSQGVFNTGGGSGAVEASDFSLSLTGGTATSPAITSVTNNSNGALTGGETVIRINFSITGTPDGGETLEVDITDGASIFAASGNASVADQTSNNTAALNDETDPVFTSTSDGDDANYRPGQTITFTADLGETGLTVTVDASVLDTSFGSVLAMADQADGTYTVTTGVLNSGTIQEGTAIAVTFTATDAAGNSQTDNSLTLLLDKTNPTPTISFPAGGRTNSAPISYTVTFDEEIDAATFTSSDITLVGATITTGPTSSDNITFTGTLTPTVTEDDVSFKINSNRVADLVGLNNFKDTTGIVYDIVAPTIAISTPIEGDGSVNATEDGDVTISGSTTGTEDGQSVSISFSDGSSSPVTGTATVTSNAWTITTDADISGLNDGAITITADVDDLTGNSATQASQTVTLDKVSPTITSVSSSTPNGRYIEGNMIAITVTFSEVVNVTGTPQITLETGTTDQVVDYSSGDGTSTLTFNYTVQAGDISADLDYTSTTALALNSGTINDGSGNAATLTLATPGAANSLGANKDFVIDTSVPTISSVSLAGDNSYIDVTFSEMIYNTTAGFGGLEPSDFNLSLTGGTATSPSVTSVTPTTGGTLVGGETTVRVNFSVTGTPDGSETLEVDLVASSVFDLSANAAVADQTTNNTATLNDETPPTIAISTPIEGDGVVNAVEDGHVTISGSTSGAEDGQTVSISFTDGSSTPITGTATVTSNAWTITADADISGLNDGTITITADVDDAAGNAATQASQTVTLDNAIPTAVVSTPSAAISVNAPNQTISGTSNEDGATINVYIDANNDGVADNATSLGNATVSSGAWSISVSLTADQANNFVVEASDAAGNLSGDVDVPTITEDSSDPASPVVTSPASAISVNAATQTISGTHSEDGVTVNVYADADNDGLIDNLTPLTSTTVSGGTWSLSVNLTEDDENNFIVRAEDAAGNTSGEVDVPTITEDSTAPTISISTPIEGDGIVEAAESSDVEISGTTTGVEDGQSVTVSFSDGTTSAGPVNATVTSNAWTASVADISALNDGNITVTADVSDLAGNAATQTSQTITLDQAPPTISSSSPADETTNVDIESDLTITFNENIQFGSGTILLNDLDNTTTDLTIDASSPGANASISGTVLTIANPSGFLEEGRNYAIRIASTAIEDIGGNAFAGIADDVTLNFTTEAAPTVSIGDASVTEGNSGTVNATFTVSLDKTSPKTITIDYATSDNTATAANNDYTAVTTTTLTFNPSETSQDVTVAVNGDTRDEDAESFFLDGTNPTNASFADNQGEATITDDDDAPTVAFASTADDGAESVNSADAVVQVSTASSKTITVDYAVTGTATGSGTDYTLADGTVTFVADDVSELVTIAGIVDDAILETNETVILTLSNPVNATLGANTTFTYTINDNDNAAVTIGDVALNEADGTVTVTATLDNAVQGGFDVDVTSADGTASTSAGDYTAVNETLTFAGTAGETQTFMVNVTDDATVEVAETITLSLSGLTTSAPVDITDDATVTINNDDAAVVTIADVTADENSGTQTITATLDVAVDGGFAFDVFTTDGTATVADSDYSSTAGSTLTFSGNAGETQTLNLSGLGDTKVEADETFTIAMRNLGFSSFTAAEIDITDVATYTITNDDAAAITIGDVSGNEDDGAITVTLTLDNPVDGGLSVDVSSADGTASTADSDYTAVTSETLTFTGTSGETQTFTLTPTADTKIEANETITASMANLMVPTVASSTITITDTGTITLDNDDTATVTIGDVSGNEDDGNITVTFTLDNAVDGGFTVDYATADGTAMTSDSDYTAGSGTVSFNGTAGETQTIQVAPTSDTKVEVDETLTVSMSNVAAPTVATSGVTITDTGTITISNDDAAVVTIADVTADENSGTQTITATLDVAVDGGFAFDVFTTDGTATVADSDYSSTAGSTLTFSGNAGETQTLNLSGLGDTKVEADETFTIAMRNLGFSSFTTAEIDITDVATYTITNDDAAAITIGDVSGNEDDGAITVTLTLDNPVDGGLSVDVSSADGTASTAVSDYTAVTSETLTFTGTSGETQTFTLTPTADTKIEANETITASMANLMVPTVASSTITITDTGTITLDNDDTATVTIGDVSGNEDDGNITVTFTLDNAVDGGFTVDYATADGTAMTSDSDYTAGSGTVSFNGTAGETQTIQVAPTPDTKVEVDETLTVSMSNVAAPTVATSGVTITDTGTITISNDDNAAVTIGDVAGNEDDGNITVTLTLDNQVDGGLTVDVSTADGTATTGDSDYTALTGETVTFTGSSGETQTVTIAAATDAKVEADETLTVSMSNITATTVATSTITTTDTGTITINNDDAAEVTIVDVSGDEDGGAITVTATLDNPVDGGFTVDVSTADGSATSTDYTSVAGETLTFSGTAGETQTFTVTPTADNTVESDETVTVSMSNLAATSLAVTITDDATVTINNDDAAAVTIADVSGAEDGGAITVTATLDNAVDGGFTVDVATADGTATPSDYTSIAGETLTFSGTAGETQTFTVTPTDDAIVESSETLTVSMSNLAATNLSVTITDNATVTITNDDAAAVTIADASGAEDGGAITVTATLDNAVDGGFTVDVATADATANAADYTSVTGQTLTFTGTAGETQTFTVTPTADQIVESDENLTVSMSNVAATSLSVTITDGAMVTITNDDVAAVTIADVSGAEDGGAITVTATLDNAVDGGFTVDVSTADGTATLADYTSVESQTLTFAGTAGETQTFTVTPTSDETVESDETVTVSMSNVAATSLSVTITDEATVTITNDDNAPVITAGQTFPIEGVLTAGMEIGTVVATDADDGTTFSGWAIVSGNANDGYAINATTGVLTVNNPAVIDLVATPSYTLTLTVTDGTNTSAEETVTIEVGDGIAPTVTLSSEVGEVTNVSPISFTATFSEFVQNFALEDLTLTNATASNLVANDAQTVFTFDLTPDAEGRVTVNIEADKAIDAVGNPNEASNTLSYFYDVTAPIATLTTSAASITSETSASIVIEFSEVVTGLELEDIQTSSGTISNLSGSMNAYMIDVAGLSEGIATITVPVGSASDAAGNGNTEGAVSWEVDLTGPSGFSVTILNPAINDLNEDNFQFEISDGEASSTFMYSIESSGGGTAVSGSGAIDANGDGNSLDDIDVSGLGDGLLTLTVELTDQYNNVGNTAADDVNKNTEEESNGIAQGYSPNGDNIDDTWTIPGIEDLPNNVVTIFNRYGTKVWETTNYDNDNNAWDSQANVDNIFGSAGLPDGTYFYVIEFPGTNTDTKSGFVILKR